MLFLHNTQLPLPLFQDPKAELTDSQVEDVMLQVKLVLQHSTWKAVGKPALIYTVTGVIQ
jgi:hypothetical protein